MIVVLIIGILAGVAIPLYLGYIQKSRVRMLVYPGLHIIETNISLYYAMHSELPDASRLPSLWEEANTDYFHADIIGDTLKITIYSPGDSRDLLTSMDGMPMYLEPVKDGSKISTWYLSGTLAKHLGIQSGAP